MEVPPRPDRTAAAERDERVRLLLADEPTGRLDSETTAAIMPLLRAVVGSAGVTVLAAAVTRPCSRRRTASSSSTR